LAVWVAYSKNKPDCPKSSGKPCENYDLCRSRVWKFDGEEIHGCLVEKITKQSFSYLEAYYFFDAKNMFPNPGGWQDQPDKLLQAINLIESERRRISQEEQKDER
jgi:hypothetical protein